MGRDAEDHPRAQEPSRLARWQIVLPHVDSVGLDGQRQVDAVVDDEEAAGLAAAPSERPRHRIEIGERHDLFAQLNDTATARQHRVEFDLDEV